MTDIKVVEAPAPVVLDVHGDNVKVQFDEPTVHVDITNTGPQGPVGTNTATIAYHHEQMVVSNAWYIAHNLDFYPNVTVQDSAGSTCEGQIAHINRNSLTVTFSYAFSGDAYLS
jgi:hypothetical protein